MIDREKGMFSDMHRNILLNLYEQISNFADSFKIIEKATGLDWMGKLHNLQYSLIEACKKDFLKNKNAYMQRLK